MAMAAKTRAFSFKRNPEGNITFFCVSCMCVYMYIISVLSGSLTGGVARETGGESTSASVNVADSATNGGWFQQA